jgi:hypothetical protein
MDDNIEVRVAKLEKTVEAIQKGRSGRRGKPILVSIEHVCGVDPKRDSAKCPDASLYRRQKGCLGDACIKKSSQYYSEYRQERAV